MCLIFNHYYYEILIGNKKGKNHLGHVTAFSEIQTHLRIDVPTLSNEQELLVFDQNALPKRNSYRYSAVF